MLSGIPDAPSTGYTVSNEQSSKSNLHLFHTGKVDFKLEEILYLKYMPTTDNLHKSLQQHELLGCYLL